MCTTNHDHVQTCPGLQSAINPSEGGATVIWGHGGHGNFYYLLFVHDFSSQPDQSLTNSGVRVALHGAGVGQVAYYTAPAGDTAGHSRWTWGLC